MLQRELFFCLFQYHIIRNNNHNWVKNCRKHFSFKKKRGQATKWVITLNAIKKEEEEEYSWSHAENSRQTSHTFWATNVSEKPVKALAFLSHGSVTALSEKVAPFSLHDPPPTPSFILVKTWRKQNPMESVVGWPRVHYTAHKLESIQGEILAGNSGYRPGRPHCSHSRL